MIIIINHYCIELLSLPWTDLAPLKMVSRYDLSRVCRNKADLYDLMQRNDYVMPSKTSAIVSIDFMFDVLHGKVWCPKITNVNHQKICTKPPPKPFLLQAIETAMHGNFATGQCTDQEVLQLQALLELLKRRDCDKQWLLTLLWCLDADHECFSRQYAFRRSKES